ncbi:MAG: hypothetical protein B6D44_16860 [Ignavibacteriales bacterium UTCHB2]|nr:MAG: hypothetical protein B6D44_16860 [Ignavibacteriales bacterium UTCHB2]
MVAVLQPDGQGVTIAADQMKPVIIMWCIQVATKLTGVNKDVFLIVEAKDVYIRNVEKYFQGHSQRN